MRLLVFESGSMSPTVETGGLALTRTVPAGELAVGDIVSVTPSSGERVTHRIVGIDATGGQTLLSLQGDANQAADPEPYPVTEADRVLFHVNHLGFVVDALASPYAVFLAGAFVAGLLALAFRRRQAAPPTRLVGTEHPSLQPWWRLLHSRVRGPWCQHALRQPRLRSPIPATVPTGDP